MPLTYDDHLLSEGALKLFHQPINHFLFRDYGAYVCMTLVGLQVGVVSDETIPEIKKRERILNAISDSDKPEDSFIDWELFKGLNCNAPFTSRDIWIRRVARPVGDEERAKYLGKQKINKIKRDHYSKVMKIKGNPTKAEEHVNKVLALIKWWKKELKKDEQQKQQEA
jgi:hypothetical protein